jgi:hypothetical protein
MLVEKREGWVRLERERAAGNVTVDLPINQDVKMDPSDVLTDSSAISRYKRLMNNSH